MSEPVRAEPCVTTWETCLGEVRWRDGKLEQLWGVTNITNTRMVNEWRVVPTVDRGQS